MNLISVRRLVISPNLRKQGYAIFAPLHVRTKCLLVNSHRGQKQHNNSHFLMGSFYSANRQSIKMSTGAEVSFSEDELRKKLTPMQYHVTQEKGTERLAIRPPIINRVMDLQQRMDHFTASAPLHTKIAFSGELTYNKETGIYSCIVCGNPLFKSDHKFESGSGWPSFYDVMNSDAVERHTDNSHGMNRVEVTCKKCSAHLGHVFTDGPNPTGERYCINSASMKFQKNGGKSEL